MQVALVFDPYELGLSVGTVNDIIADLEAGNDSYHRVWLFDEATHPELKSALLRKLEEVNVVYDYILLKISW